MRKGTVLTGGIVLIVVMMLVAAQKEDPKDAAKEKEIKAAIEAKLAAQKQAPIGKEPAANPFAEMMAQWEASQAKGPEHKKFEAMVGKWDTQTKMWFTPDMEPMTSKGTAEFRMILDGRYIEQKFKCPDMMGKPFEGLGLEGYDTIKKKFVSIWLDDTSTGIFLTEGTADESGKVCTYHGKCIDPAAPNKEKPCKSIAREVSKDELVFEMYDTTPDGKEFLSMEITYTRSK